MSVGFRPQSDADQQVLDALDFAPPCGYCDHEKYGNGPAIWIVVFKPRTSCCKGPTRGVVYYCDACWTWRNSLGVVRCNGCGAQKPYLEDIARVEAL